jgi:hypothetical protein
LARQAGGRRDDRIAAVPQRGGFGRCPQPATALIEQWRHHHELRDERGFEIRVALHRTCVRSRS